MPVFPAQPPATPFTPASTAHRSAGSPHATCPRLACAVADLDAAYAELTARHILLSGPPEDHGVCRHLDLVDPDGHPLILHQRADGTCG